MTSFFHSSWEWEFKISCCLRTCSFQNTSFEHSYNMSVSYNMLVAQLEHLGCFQDPGHSHCGRHNFYKILSKIQISALSSTALFSKHLCNRGFLSLGVSLQAVVLYKSVIMITKTVVDMTYKGSVTHQLRGRVQYKNQCMRCIMQNTRVSCIRLLCTPAWRSLCLRLTISMHSSLWFL